MSPQTPTREFTKGPSVRRLIAILVISSLCSGWILNILFFSTSVTNDTAKRTALVASVKTDLQLLQIESDYDYDTVSSDGRPLYKHEHLSTCAAYEALLGLDSNQASLYMSDCYTVWVKDARLNISEKMVLLNGVVKVQKDLALRLEMEAEEDREKRWESSSDLGTHGDATKSAVMLTDFNAFRKLEKSAFIVTVYVLPSDKLPGLSTLTRSDMDGNYIAQDYFRCTTSSATKQNIKQDNTHNVKCRSDLLYIEQTYYNMQVEFYNYHEWRYDLGTPIKSKAHNASRAPARKTPPQKVATDIKKPPNVITYVHLIRNAFLVEPGIIYQLDDGLAIAPLQCSPKSKLTFSPTAIRKVDHVLDTVFSITEFFTDTDFRFDFYHSYGRATMKLAAYTDFLRTNPLAHIHVRGKAAAQFIQIFIREVLHLDNLVIEGTVMAKVVILPEGMPCHYPGYLYTQTSQRMFAKQLNLDTEEDNPKSILYIQGYIKEEDYVIDYLSKLAKRYNLSLNVYNEAQNMTIHEKAKLFHSALFILSPHVPALSNVIFAHARSAVFEVTCASLPSTFAVMAHHLGLRYHVFYVTFGRDRKCVHDVSIAAGGVNNLIDFETDVDQILKIVTDAFK